MAAPDDEAREAQRSSGHRPVLLDACMRALALRPDGRYVDATFGRGGHSAAILRALGDRGRLVAIDRDPAAVAVGRQWRDPRFAIEHARFSQLRDVLARHALDQVDGILLDLGVSSPQLDEAGRGFSFREDGPLDMRMDPGRGMSARQWLLEASEQDIARVVKDYGEERFAVAIAKAIDARRRQAGEHAFQTTGELAALVAGVVRRRQRRPELGKDPATRTFQALRIFVNQELEELALVLERSLDLLAARGRLAVVSFHSLEDRMVKQFFARAAGRDAPRDPVTGVPRPLTAPRLRLVERVRPDAAESTANPRARSAVLRVAERLPDPS